MYNEVEGGVATGPMAHAELTLPKPQVGPSHPFKNQKNHACLKAYLQQRLVLGARRRDNELNRLVQIDKNIAGWIRLSAEDKKRARKKRTDGIPLAIEMNLPLAFVHLDDMMTYFATTFSPNRGMFYQNGDPEDVDQAQQLVTLMNNHAIAAGYFREVLLGIYSLLKYNSGGFHMFWAKENGPQISKDDKGQDQVSTVLKWQGNRLEALDKYNLLSDPAVHPSRLYCDGEFSGQAKAKSFYWLQNKASQGVYFNCETALQSWNGNGQFTYYRNPPQQANFDTNGVDQGMDDWVSILSGNDFSESGANFELVEIYCKLNPTDFGLVEGNAEVRKARSRYEMWRFTLLNNDTIIEATYMNNIHGQIPHYMGVMNDDVMGTSQKSPAEILAPLQDFASSLLNTHVQAQRKKLWGLTIYDPSMVDLKEIPDGEVVARIPMKPAAMGRDVRTGIWQPTDSSDTNQTMDDMGKVMDIINQFFPTQAAPSQIANIDRAVDSQVAAVQQGANRRQQKAARLLDDSIFRPIRAGMYYNIIQYQPDADNVMDFYTGKPIKIDISSLRNTDLPFIIGQGLKAIDRQAAAKNLQQIIFALIQAPQAAQGVDLLGLIDYWTSMIDVDVNMKQFAAAPPPQADPNAQPAVDSAGNPIQPAYSPSAVTGAIHKGGAPAA